MDNSGLFNDPASLLDFEDPETIESVFQGIEATLAEMNGDIDDFLIDPQLTSSVPATATAVPAEPEQIAVNSFENDTAAASSSADVTAIATAAAGGTDPFLSNDFSEFIDNSSLLFDSNLYDLADVEGAQGLLALAHTATNVNWEVGTAAATATTTDNVVPDTGVTGANAADPAVPVLPSNAPRTSINAQVGRIDPASVLHPNNWTDKCTPPENMNPQEKAQFMEFVRASAVLLDPVPVAEAAMKELKRRQETTPKEDNRVKKRSPPKKQKTPRSTPKKTRPILPATANSTAQLSTGITQTSSQAASVFGSQYTGAAGVQNSPELSAPLGFSISEDILAGFEDPIQHFGQNTPTFPSYNFNNMPPNRINGLPPAGPGPVHPVNRIFPTFPRETPEGEALHVPTGRLVCLKYSGWTKMDLYAEHDIGSRSLLCKDDVVIAVLPNRILFARIPSTLIHEHALENLEEVTKHIKWVIGDDNEDGNGLHLYLLSPMNEIGNPSYVYRSGTNLEFNGQEGGGAGDRNDERARAEAVREHMLNFAKQLSNSTFYYKGYMNTSHSLVEEQHKRCYIRVGPFAQEGDGVEARPHVLVDDCLGRSVVLDFVLGPAQ